MRKSISLAQVIRGILLSGAVSALPALPAHADPAGDETPPTPTTAQLGKIEVTGTRIKRADVEAARPVTVITQQQIRATGLSSIGDVLQLLPSAGAAVNSQFNNGGDGKTNADLRNLGPNRLLVLLDGKRVVSGLGGDVDLNTIPASIIDHVEVLQDGASAVYGSDAISGVVNIITVKQYEGAEANALLGEYDAHADGGGWDGRSQQYDFTVGSAGQRSGVVLSVSYVNEAPVSAGDRTISREPVIGAGLDAGSFRTPNGSFRMFIPSGACPGKASLQTDGTCFMTLINAPATRPTAANFRDFNPGIDAFNFAPANYLVTPSERTGFYVQGRYDLRENLSFDARVLFTDRKSSQQLAPETLGIGAFAQALADGTPLSISGKNPFNPFHEDLVADSSAACLAAGTCDELLLLGRRLSEGGNRVFNQDVRNFQFNGGFRGFFSLFGREWDWDAGYVYGDNYEGDRATGVVNTTRMQAELGAAGSAPCANAGSGCVPLNLFGGDGSITPAMLNYFMFEQHDVVEETLRDYTANATGELLDLPAGPLSMALGAEYLETDGFSHPDALVVQGDTGGSAIPATEGRERTVAQYLEFDVPLVAGAPFMKSVDLDLATRWSQFHWQGGDVGTNNQAAHDTSSSSGNASLRWQATDALLLRASWSQSFRIPSISDLFLADSQAPDFLTDPCVVEADNPVKAPRCGAGPYTLQLPGSGLINTTIGGNNRLTPEHAISQTVGFVYDPDWLTGFDFSADYYKINLSNAIGQVPGQLILDGCYQFGLPQYCSLIRRSGGDHSANAPGAIVNVQNLTTNAGGIKVEGIDLQANYAFPASAAGDFKLGLDWSFTKQYVATLAFATGYSSQELSGTTTNGAGTAGTSSVTGGVPKQRATLTLGWTRGAWSAGWTAEYISALTEDCAESIAEPPSRCPLTVNFPFETTAVPGNHIGATVYHDVRATYHLDALNLDLTVGVRNLFDKQPPISMSVFANSYLPTYYRTPGRFFFAGAGVKF